MKRKTELVKIARKTIAVSMAAVTTMGAVPILSGSIVYADDSNYYIINTSSYMSRLRKHFDDYEFELSFKATDEDNNELVNEVRGKKILEEGKIQVNEGKEYTFKEAGLDFVNYGAGPSYSSFKSTNLEFMKEFCNAETLNVKVTTPDGNIVEAEITNALSQEEREELSKQDSDTTEETGGVETPKEDDSKFYVVSKNHYMTRLKADYSNNPIFQLGFEKYNEADEVLIDMAKAEKLLAEGYIQINDGKKFTFKEAGLKLANYGMGPSDSSFESKNVDFIKEFYNSDDIKVSITTPGGNVVEGKVPNEMDEAQREAFKASLGEETDNTDNTEETASEGDVYSATVKLMHSANGDTNYVYKDQSMAGAVLSDKAEVITTEDGQKLILHFVVAKVMGATSYGTGLELTTKEFGKLKVNEKGDIKTEFILASDNSGICIVDLPKLENKVYEGYIYSNIMSNTVAVKVDDLKKTKVLKEGLDELVEKVKKETEGKEYYKKGKDAFDKALEAASEKDNYAEHYINLLKAFNKLSEKKANPFEDGDLFFVPTEATSAFANPPGTNKKILKDWGRVTKKDDKTILELDYQTYSDWSGKSEVKAVKIFGKDGKTELPVEFIKNNDGSAKLKFEMPFYPESGIFKTVLIDSNDREWESDLILDYSKIHKGMRPELITEAIHKADDYQTGWSGAYDGKISVDRKDFYSEKSFERYIAAIKKGEEDLKPENRADLTQEKIDEDIANIFAAKEGLVYKQAAGDANTANLGMAGINNPGNVYLDEKPHIIEAPWVGSRIKFAGKTYKVLDNGLSDKEEEKTDKIFIMADDSIVKPWHNTDTVVRWNDSDLRTYLNAEYYNKFNEVEKNLIKETNLITRDASSTFNSIFEDQDSTPIETKDKVFVLDISDMKSPRYGFANLGSRKYSNYYFIRNLGKDDYATKLKLAGVKPKGQLETFNQAFNMETEVYPAMNIDKSKIFMTIDSEVGISDGLKPVEETEDNTWNLVIKDEAKKLDIKTSKVKDDKVVIDYNSENTDGDDLVVAIVKDGDIDTGKLKSIGKIAKTSANGKQEIKVSGFDEATDKLYIMSMNLKDSVITSSDAVELDAKGIEEAKPETKPSKPSTPSKDSNKLKAYDVAVFMKKYKTDEASMSSNSVDKMVTIVERGSKNEVIMKFKPMKFMGLEGHLLKMKVAGKDVKVLEKDSEGRPVKISFEVKGTPERISASVEVDAMNEIAGKPSPQKVDIVLDWDNKTNEREIEESKISSSSSSTGSAKVEENTKLDKTYTRIAGDDRYETSVAISKKYFNKAENIVIANGVNSADALVSASFAKMKKAPILLSDTAKISDSVLNEIKRLGAKNVTIIGGVNSVSDQVVSSLKAQGLNVERIAGKDRYETSIKLADNLVKTNKTKKLVVVNGMKDADALSISSLATKENLPVVMINNSDNTQLKNTLTNWKVDELTVVGGVKSISEETVKAFGIKKNTRIAGEDRYETSLKIAQRSYAKPGVVFMANGETMVDALSGGGVTYKEKAPIVLVKKNSMKENVKKYIEKASGKLIALGGEKTLNIK